MTGVPGEPIRGFFTPATMLWRVNREMVLLLAGGRALLMQLAHPKIAAGVAQHSRFQQDPLERLRRTMNSMWSIVFDPMAQARETLEQVKRVHRRVRGVTPPGEPLYGGQPYQALDPELLLWVHATLIDSAIAGYELFVAPLTAVEWTRYYEDSRRLAQLFEIPEKIVPGSLAEFGAYMERMIAGAIAVGPVARSLARDILHPAPWVLKGAGPLFSLVTAGLLPAPLRGGYGLGWSPRREKLFRMSAAFVRGLRPLVPAPLRLVPNARRPRESETC